MRAYDDVPWEEGGNNKKLSVFLSFGRKVGETRNGESRDLKPSEGSQEVRPRRDQVKIFTA